MNQRTGDYSRIAAPVYHKVFLGGQLLISDMYNRQDAKKCKPRLCFLGAPEIKCLCQVKEQALCTWDLSYAFEFFG